MQKKSVGKYSLVGLILFIAATVSAAVIPTEIIGEGPDNGTLRADSGIGVDQNVGILSCVNDNDLVFSCNVTEGTATTVPPQLASTVEGLQTINCTSRSAAGWGTSILEVL